MLRWNRLWVVASNKEQGSVSWTLCGPHLDTLWHIFVFWLSWHDALSAKSGQVGSWDGGKLLTPFGGPPSDSVPFPPLPCPVSSPSTLLSLSPFCSQRAANKVGHGGTAERSPHWHVSDGKKRRPSPKRIGTACLCSGSPRGAEFLFWSGHSNRPDFQGPAMCEILCQVLWALVSLSPSDLVRSPVLSPGGEECGQRVMTPALSNVWLLGRTSWK